MDDSTHFLHIFISLIWHSVTWMFKILNWNLANSETQILFRGLCSTHGIIIKDFLASFHKSEKLFSQGLTKLDANSLLLNDSHFSELQQSQNTIKTHTHTYTYTLNINYTKSHHSLTVTLSTLIHNKSTQQPAAVHPVSTPHGQLGSTWLTTHILEEHGKVRKDKPFIGVHRRWEKRTTYHTGKTWVRTNGPSQDHSQWEVRRNIYQGTAEVLPWEEETIPSLAIICFLSFRQQAQGFHTLLRDRLASICYYGTAYLHCSFMSLYLSLHAAFLVRIPDDSGKCCVPKWQPSTFGKLDVTVLFIRTGHDGITQWTTPSHPTELTGEASHYRIQQWPASLHPDQAIHMHRLTLEVTRHRAPPQQN